jgi:ABC-type branched-subunit amino acid transport system substrate-binding protein
MDTLLKIGARLRAAALVAAIAAAVPATAVAQAPQGITDTEIVIGTHQDLSGPVAALGGPLRDGMVLAVEDINAAGGIHGRKLRLVVEDTSFDPKKAVLATQKLLTQDKVFAMVAPLGTAPTQASMPLMLERGVPLLFAGTPADFTYTPFHKLKFALSSPYGEQVRAQVKWAYEKLGKRRFGVLYQDDETGLNVLRAVEEQLKVHGLAVAERASYKRGAIDYSSQIARLKAANVDVLILGTIVRETAAAKMEARKQGWNVDMMVNVAGTNSAVFTIAGAETMEGLYGQSQFLPLDSAEQPAAAKAVIERYKARFGKNPEDGIVFGYTSVMLFAEGAKNAGRDLTVDSLVKGLEKVRNWTTVFAASPVSFSETERLGVRATMVMQARGGKFVPITPPITY